MDNEKTVKKTLAVIFGAVLALSSTPMVSVAEDTTTATEETTTSTEEAAETTTSAEEEETEEEVEEEKEEDENIEWFKADLAEYDDSLSLISYESSPEAANSSKKAKKADPTPVALNVTGGYVGDIPWFESEPVIESVPGEFAVVTYGWGHGVGMSQNGANFYATYSGWTYQDILFHYYPGTYLMNTGLAYDEEITVNGVSGDVLSMVSQIVFNEIGGTMNYEAMKAQAVAVYTYCKYNGNDASDLRCKPCPPQVVVDAVAEVLGQALFYNDDYALTMFSASSGGITANCWEVFYSDVPYLRAVSSDYDTAYDPHYGTVTYIDDFQLRNMIQEAYGIQLSDDPNNWIKPQYSDVTGYVTNINIDDQMTVRGYEFKLAIGLKSSKFNVYYTPRPDGEPIPDGVSEPKVVEANYTQTPGVYYPNSYPTDIGWTPDYEEEDEYTEDEYYDDTYEDNWYEDENNWYDDTTAEDWYQNPDDWSATDYNYYGDDGSDYDYQY